MFKLLFWEKYCTVPTKKKKEKVWISLQLDNKKKKKIIKTFHKKKFVSFKMIYFIIISNSETMATNENENSGNSDGTTKLNRKWSLQGPVDY